MLKHKRVKYFASILIISIAFSHTACNKEQKEQEYVLLRKWLKENNISDEKARKSGLYYIESGFSGIESINALPPEWGDTIILAYKGYLLADTSKIFDQRTIENPLSYIYQKDMSIPGWEEGIGLTRKGITAKLIVPSKLAYKAKQTGIIPPYSTLIFDLRIINIKR